MSNNYDVEINTTVPVFFTVVVIGIFLVVAFFCEFFSNGSLRERISEQRTQIEKQEIKISELESRLQKQND